MAMRSFADVARIVDLQTRAAKMQAAAWTMPKENFFPNMLGFMAHIDLNLAVQVATAFEIACQKHAEMIDDMVENPKLAVKAIKEGVEKSARKKRG